LPAATSMTVSSMNFMGCNRDQNKRAPGLPGLLLAAAAPRCASGRLDAHRLTAERTLGGVADAAIDQREQRVVLARADIGTGVELGAALADDDRARRNHLAAEHLDPEHLGLRVAPVARG